MRVTGRRDAPGLSPQCVSQWMRTIRHVTASADTAKTYTPRSAGRALIYNPHRFPSLAEFGPAMNCP